MTDSGPGIDPAIAEKIFDPFFTTKQEGQGSGLGLSMAYGVAENHGGKLRLVLPDQGGCRFEVDLPALTDAEKDKLTGSRSGRSEEIIIGG